MMNMSRYTLAVCVMAFALSTGVLADPGRGLHAAGLASCDDGVCKLTGDVTYSKAIAACKVIGAPLLKVNANDQKTISKFLAEQLGLDAKVWVTSAPGFRTPQPYLTFRAVASTSLGGKSIETDSTARHPALCGPFARKKITFVHLNDVHARVEPANSGAGPCAEADAAAGACYGGFARMVAVVKAIKADPTAGEVVVLDAGDQFMGTVWDYVYKGTEAVPFQKLLGVQAMTVGNHEFDYGPDGLANYAQKADRIWPLLACNVDASKHPVLKDVIKPYTIITLSDGTKLGVVGFITKDTPFLSSPGPNIVFSDVNAAAQQAVHSVRAAGADIVVGLSHQGYFEDLDTATKVTGMDLIIGGHSHTFLYPPNRSVPMLVGTTTDPVIGPYPTPFTPGSATPVLQAFWASRYLGRFEANFVGNKLVGGSGAPILLGDKASSNTVVPDNETLAVIDALSGPVKSFGLEVVGQTAVKLSGDRSDVRAGETNLGNLICDALVWETVRTNIAAAGYGNLTVCLTNGGGIRASIQAPLGQAYPYDVTQGDVLTVLPFGNYLSIKLLTGAQLLQALESGVSGGLGQGRFPQVSGLRFGYALSKAPSPPEAPPSRIVGVQVLSPTTGVYGPIDLAAKYPLVTNNFVAAGGDFYDSIKEAPFIYEAGAPMDRVVSDFIAEYSPVSPTIEGRIVNCEAPENVAAPICVPSP